MNQHPIVLIDPVFKWLDHAIAEYGLYLYMVTVWLSPLLIVWILNGGFWRRTARSRRWVTPPPLPKRPIAMPPPLPPPLIAGEPDRFPDDDGDSFAA